MHRTKDPTTKDMLKKKLLPIPSKDFMDPFFKKYEYVRYADDLLISIVGTHKDRMEITQKVDSF